MKNEALKLALEALDNLLYWDNGKPEYDEAREAITAIKEALAAPKQEPDAMGCKCAECGAWQRWTPSGMVCKNGHGGASGINQRLYTTPPAAPVQEPVETWEDLHNALQRIDTAAVGLPTFEVRHEGGLDAVVQNIVDAIVALHEDRTTPPAAQPAQEPVARIAVLEAALNEIASAGMSPSPEMSDDGKTAWHASQAWRFIGIAARAIELALAPVGERCCYHDSDCAVHNMPAYPAGPCDCSLASLAQPAQEPVIGTKISQELADNVQCLIDIVHITAIRDEQRKLNKNT